MRVRLARVGEGAVSVDLADRAGLPVLSVRELLVRPVSAKALSAAVAAAAGGGGGLFEVAWSPIALENNDIGDDLVVWEPSSATDSVVGSVHAAAQDALGAVQSWLAGNGSGVLVVLTRGAVGSAAEEVTDLGRRDGVGIGAVRAGRASGSGDLGGLGWLDGRSGCHPLW